MLFRKITLYKIIIYFDIELDRWGLNKLLNAITLLTNTLKHSQLHKRTN